MKNLTSLALICFVLISGLATAQPLAVYVSDAGNFNIGPWQIAKFDQNGTFEGALMNTDDDIVWPQDIIFLENDGAVLISNLGPAGNISKHDWASGDFIGDFADGLGGPTRMKIGPDGLLYVLQWSNTVNKVLRYDLDGTFVDEFTSVGVPQSIGIDWDAAGDLYVSSYGTSIVRKFNGTTGIDEGLFINSDLNGPTNIFFEASGNLIVFDYNTGIIKRFDAVGNYVEDVITGLLGPEGFAFFPNGDILIGNGGDGSIKRYDSSYNFLGNFVEPGILLTPNAIVIRDDVPLSIPVNELNAFFVTPTIGSYFTFNTKVTDAYEKLGVYDTIGKLVETVKIAENSVWDASRLSEGSYFLVAIKDGKKASQKIIITNK